MREKRIDDMTFDELADFGKEIEELEKEFNAMSREEQLKSIGMTEEEVERSKNKILNMIEGYKFLADVQNLVDK